MRAAVATGNLQQKAADLEATRATFASRKAAAAAAEADGFEEEPKADKEEKEEEEAKAGSDDGGETSKLGDLVQTLNRKATKVQGEVHKAISSQPDVIPEVTEQDKDEVFGLLADILLTPPPFLTAESLKVAQPPLEVRVLRSAALIDLESCLGMVAAACPDSSEVVAALRTWVASK
jgi:hypothetical protein